MVRNSFKKCCIGYRLDGIDDYAIHESEGTLDSCSDCSDECIQKKGMVSSEIWTLLCMVSASNMRGFFVCFSPESSKLGMRGISAELRYPKKSFIFNRNLLLQTMCQVQTIVQKIWYDWRCESTKMVRSLFFIIIFVPKQEEKWHAQEKQQRQPNPRKAWFTPLADMNTLYCKLNLLF